MITLVIKHRFLFRPVLLSSIARPFHGMKESLRFFNVVQEFLPDEKQRLLAMPANDAARRFVTLFSKAYFPIYQPGEIQSWQLNRDLGEIQSWQLNRDLMEEVSRFVDIERHGLRMENYDSGPMGMAQILAACICENPFGEGPVVERNVWTNRVSRLPVVDRLGKASPAAVKLLPKKGWGLAQVEAALGNSGKYPGLLDWCRWLFKQTGTAWLDERHDWRWTREEVELLTRQYAVYQAADGRMKEFDKWLGADFPGRSVEVIKYIKAELKKTPAEVFQPEVSHGEEV